MGESCTETNIDTSVSARTYLLLAVVLVAGILLRLGGDTMHRDLWYDEMQSVHFAAQPLPDVAIEVLRIDVHPPVYYLQLSMWMGISTNTLFLIANSLLWSALAVVALFYSGRKLFGTRVGILAAALFAVAEPAVAQGQNIRMYAMLMCFAIVVFHFTEQFIRFGGKALYWAFAATVLLAFSHGASFIALFAFFSYGAMRFYHRVRRGDSPMKSAVRWGIMQAAVAVMYLPWLYLAIRHGGAHLIIPGIGEIVSDLGSLFVGPDLPIWVHFIALAVAVLLLAAASLYRFEFRVGSLAFLLVPVVTVYLVSIVIKPVWNIRAMLFALPLLCMFLAGGIEYLLKRKGVASAQWRIAAWVAGIVVIAGMLAGTFFNLPTDRWGSGIRSVANYIKAHGSEGDLVIGPEGRHVWGLRWYMDGPGRYETRKDEIEKSFRYVELETSLSEAVFQRQPAWIIVADPVLIRDFHLTPLKKIGRYTLCRIEPRSHS